jgi:hypothetical protein
MLLGSILFNLLKEKNMKELIEYLEKKEFIEEANSLRNGGTSLKLSEKNIGDVEIKEIIELLKKNTTLISLSFWGNKIGNAGAKEIAKLLKTNKTITSLDLGYNNITGAGTKELEQALKINVTLISLNLAWNQIDALIAKKIRGYLLRNLGIANIAKENDKKGSCIMSFENIKV